MVIEKFKPGCIEDNYKRDILITHQDAVSELS
jgi:hypothetical protein